VPAEAEHVHPPAQSLVGLVPTEPPGDADQLVYVVGDAEGTDAPIDVKPLTAWLRVGR
jgi:hypothetical protein